MKTVRVVAGIIIEDGKVFATQRGYVDIRGCASALALSRTGKGNADFGDIRRLRKIRMR